MLAKYIFCLNYNSFEVLFKSNLFTKNSIKLVSKNVSKATKTIKLRPNNLKIKPKKQSED